MAHHNTCQGKTPAPGHTGAVPSIVRTWVSALTTWWAATLVVFGLAACQPVPTSPLKVGVNPWVGYDPLVLARDEGMLDSRQVKVVELASSSENLRHFRNGLLDGAALTLDEALRLADQQADVRIVAVLSASAGADVVVARSGIHSPAQLRGRRLAVEQTTVGALMLRRLLQAGGLQPQDLDVRNMEASQHLVALRNGRIDAAVTFEPLAGAMRAEGFAGIFDSRDMPGDIVDVLVVRASRLASHPQQVDALVRGWGLGLQQLQKDPQRSAQAMANGVDLSPAEYLATFRGLRFFNEQENIALLSGRPRLLGQQSEGLALTLQSMGLIRETPDWGQILDEDWANRLQSMEGLPP